MKFSGYLLTALLMAGASVPAAAAQLVTNGGFETGNLSGWTLVGQTTFTGVASGANVISGQYTAFSGPDTVGSGFGQTVGTVAGQSYDISFKFKSFSSVANNYIKVSLGSDLLFAQLFATDNTNVATVNVTTLASASNQFLSFELWSPSSFFLIDDISVADSAATPVPEPATWAMMIGGFGMVGGAMRRRRVTTAFA